MVKYILITGGVISGIGKGVIASSIGLLLRKIGYRVTAIKIDPYLNVDAGTMSPFEHGEVFILDDGGEVDLDLGNYERFLDVTLSKDNNITTGKIYKRVIERERKGEYLGKTVQVVPHICDAIQEWIENVAKIPTSTPPSSPKGERKAPGKSPLGPESAPDICIIELGGTVGDIESMPFVEAMRQFQFRVGKSNFVEIHVSLVPVLGAGGEQKTKPTQSSVRSLRSLGLSPDLIMCRSDKPIGPDVAQKISQFCHVPQDCVIGVHNLSNMYHVPLLIQEQNICQKILSIFQLPVSEKIDQHFQTWKQMASLVDELFASPPEKTLRIAMVGKYTGLADSYLSMTKSITHASIHERIKVEVVWIESVNLDPESKSSNPEEYKKNWEALKSCHGIIVPGGFGDRGVQGMIECCQYARENNIPFLGICLGFQVAVIETSRNVVGWADANSEEFNDKVEHPVVIFMPEGSRTHLGGTMRLGVRDAIFKDFDSQISKLYGSQKVIRERHRHRYEANPRLVPEIEAKSKLRFVAQDETGERMEILELLDHPYFVGTQFHPEMKSRPEKPSPPFTGLIRAAMKHSQIQPAQL